MLVTVNCLMTVSPSPQYYLAKLMHSLNTASTSSHADLTLSAGHSTNSVTLHASYLCSLSPLLSSLLSSSDSPFTILLPAASHYSLTLIRELLYTGKCQGTLVQLEDAVQLLDMLGVQIQNEVVGCGDSVGQVAHETFFLACEATNILVLNEEVVSSVLPEVALDNSNSAELPLDESCNQDQFASKFVWADEVHHALNLNKIDEVKSPSSCSNSEIFLSDEEIVENIKRQISHNERFQPCNQSNLKRHKQAKHSEHVNIELGPSNKVQESDNIEIGTIPSSGNSDVLVSDTEVEEIFGRHFNQLDGISDTTKIKRQVRCYPCSQCGYIATQKSNLKRHKQTQHEKINLGQFPCYQCDYIATQNGHLKRHVLAKHSLERFECKLCEKTFTVKEVLNRHIQSLHENQTYPCPECKFVAKRRETLNYHVQWKHSEENATCDECGYQAATLKLIIRHKLRIHKGIRFPCNKCDYQATEKSTLLHHIKATHEKIRFHCHKCSRKFTKKSTLKRHIILKHSMNM